MSKPKKTAPPCRWRSLTGMRYICAVNAAAPRPVLPWLHCCDCAKHEAPAKEAPDV